jgi:hypothetical protein
MKSILPIFLLLFASLSCITDNSEPFNGIEFDGTGYRPIYATAEEVAKIQVQEARPLSKPGKIYHLDPYIFVNESGEGIHIINNADPRNPENLSFISIPGNYDMAAKGTWLYADNMSNMVVFDISDPKSPKLTKTIADAIPVNNYPSFRNIYFECAEDKKGIVVGWEKVPMSERPKCYR